MSVEIYNNVKSLVENAVSETVSAISSFQYNFAPDTVVIPDVPFVTTINATVPNAPTYLPPSVPITTVAGSLTRASHNALSSVVGSMSFAALPSSLAYQTPVHADVLPNYGTPTSPGQPPQTGFVSIPDSAGLTSVAAPAIAVGIPPDLEPIPLLDYTTYGFEKLEVVIPPVLEVPGVDKLQNPEQLIVTLDPNLLAAIKHTLSGQDIMSVQQQLYNLATHDLRRERVDAERKLFAGSAARGFGDANGPLFEAVADLNYETRLKDGESYEKGRDFLYETAKTKLVEAVQQSIALETANFAVHMAYAGKLSEVFAVNAALHTQLFNYTLEMYELQLKTVNSVIAAYNTYVGVVVDEQKAENAELGVARAKLQSNKARISMYEAQGRTAGVRADVFETEVQQSTFAIEEYTTYIDGLLMNIDIQQENIKAYKDGLSAYSEALQVDKSKIDAYGVQIQTEGSAVDVYKSNWDLYASAHSALSGQNSAVSSFNSASLQALNAEIGVFKAAADEQGAYLRGITTWADTNRSIAGDFVRGVNQTVSYYTQHNSTLSNVEEADVSLKLTIEDMKSTQLALDSQREAAQATIDAGLLAAEATTYAGQAQAAYSVQSIGATLGASASDSEAQSFSVKGSMSKSYNKSYAYTKSATLSGS